jgi:hypothetical protein
MGISTLASNYEQGVGHGPAQAIALKIRCNFLKITGGTHRPVQLWCLSSSEGRGGTTLLCKHLIEIMTAGSYSSCADN